MNGYKEEEREEGKMKEVQPERGRDHLFIILAIQGAGQKISVQDYDSSFFSRTA